VSAYYLTSNEYISSYIMA